MEPLKSLAAGDKFSAYISAMFGKPVAPSLAAAAGTFSLLVAFGRCHLRLEDSFVAAILSSLSLGTLLTVFKFV